MAIVRGKYTGEYTRKAREVSERRHKTGRDSLGRLWPNRHQHPALEDVILDHVSTRSWIKSMELYDCVTNDYGKVSRRVFYRHLAWLRDAGRLLVEVKAPRQHLYRKPNGKTAIKV